MSKPAGYRITILEFVICICADETSGFSDRVHSARVYSVNFTESLSKCHLYQKRLKARLNIRKNEITFQVLHFNFQINLCYHLMGLRLRFEWFTLH